MTLHVDRYEHASSVVSRTPLLFLHGWGMHGGVWTGTAENLAMHLTVQAVDLPGHGYSADRKSDDAVAPSVQESDISGRTGADGLDGIVDQLSAQFPSPLIVCGWSLGAQIALRWAVRRPQQIERLILVGATPCFIAREGWDHGLSGRVLKEFADRLGQNYELTLKRFLALQVQGGERALEWLSVLRHIVFRRGKPDLAALAGGLRILRDTDLRSAVSGVRQPCLVITGQRDTLTPPQASDFLARRLLDARMVTIMGAAHAPFLSHRQEFVEQVLDFIVGKQT